MRAIDIKTGRFFQYKERIWMKIEPGHTLFRSCTIHEVVNRGDIFAVETISGRFTVVSGKAEVIRIKIKKDLEGTPE